MSEDTTLLRTIRAEVDVLLQWCVRQACDSGANLRSIPSMTHTRARLCAKVTALMPPIFGEFHNALTVEQISGVPEGALCAVDKTLIRNGVQLKFGGRHICIHNMYQPLWYHYFRLRHFPQLVLGFVTVWARQETRGKHVVAHWSNMVYRMWQQSVESITTFLEK
jgi:hypothetical protein